MSNTIMIITAVLLIIAVVMKIFMRPSGYKNAGAEDFDNLIRNGGAQILDVRSKSEFADGHLKGAILIDVTGPDFKKKALEKLDKSKPVAVYCLSGGRSSTAAGILVREGYDATSLSGGIISWTRANKPIVR